MPLDPATNMTTGFCLVTYVTAEAAKRAVAGLDKAAFDPTHRISVMRLDEVQALRSGNGPRVTDRVEARAGEDDSYWLVDEQARDEFVLRFSNTEKDRADEKEKHETEVHWANMRGAPALDYGGERHKVSGKNWAETMIRWSPRGTYLTTMHAPGAKLWHGKGFRDGFRLLHENVHDILWSPDERYVCTWNGYPNNPNAKRAFVVWDARTGLECRQFKQAEQSDVTHKFSWSADGNYLARIVSEMAPNKTPVELIHVYEAPHFRLLEDRSIRAPGARDLQWCPRQNNILAWWSPERENLPTSISMLRIPSKDYVKPRLLCDVQDVRVVWHPAGLFCAVMAEKLTRGQVARKKKATGGKMLAEASAPSVGGPLKLASAGFSIEVMRFKSKDVPVDVIEVKERVLQFAWEPMNARFALLTGEGSRTAVQFFALGEKLGITETHRIENQSISALHWSPRGDILLMTGLGMSMGGLLNFYDAEARRSLAEVTHEAASAVAWDPSGRMVTSYKTRPLGGPMHARDAVSNGYILWSFQGQKIHSSDKPKLFQFAWRPRPEALLTEEETRDVTKNLKKFIQRYQDDDKARISRKDMLSRLRKRKALDEFRALKNERSIEREREKENRLIQREALNLGELEVGDGTQGREGDILLEETYEILLSEVVTSVAE
jgi:translation initiation factor 3 subunit B